ncbi:MAG TPA: alpha/beta hydrolase-fold protein [Candidatus Saccharicenans sp.]|nr:alpha/beta hydrolase-fold protein [Candidatus Saccharicenans sp.]HQI22358.1 alpha/beta hydrolase-fold protein [Candidatus Saccharicenans sp.]
MERILNRTKGQGIILLALIVLCLLLPENGQAQPAGKVQEGLKFSSQILGQEVRYTVYLPPDYDTSNRRYPVVYLLHGYTDNDMAWVQFGQVNLIVDRAIASGELPPIIIVMPDGGVSWYINDYQGKVRYEDMFCQELIPYIDSNYRTRAAREFRGVAGLSMGGWGTLIYALRHPDLFAAAAAFSAAVWTDEEIIATDDKTYEQIFARLYGPGLKGRERLTPHFQSYNPLQLVKMLPVDKIKQVRFYLDCGDDDFLYKGNAALHVAMRDRKIPHEARMRDGGHTWSYWRTGILDGLKFISASFSR